MSIEPGNYDFKIYQGATFSRVITWKDESGALVDLTGYSARMQIRKKIDGDSIIELTTSNGRITLGGAAGTITLNISATDTAALLSNGVYDLELVASGNIVTRLLEGSVTLSREVTK